jgi:4a-hydroxytetrahydrobiopterin dehydratase
MSDLHQEACLPCNGGEPVALTAAEQTELLAMIAGWIIDGSGQLQKTIPTNSFLKGLAITQAITPIAEGQNHHPDILLTYPKLVINLITHSANGLTRADFVMAAKIDNVLAAREF